MVYLKNNNTIYVMDSDITIKKGKLYHLYIGDKDIFSTDDEQCIKYFFEEIQKQIKDGKKLINFNELIGSYKK